MGDLTKILDGNVGEVKDALTGKSHVDLLELRKQEAAGKNRAGVLSAIDAALAPDDGAAGSGDGATITEIVTSTSDQVGAGAGADGVTVDPGIFAGADGPEDNGIAPAEAFDAAGAPQQIVPDVDMSHPAVDADPRAHTSAAQNRIDFNDPSLDGPDAVEKNLQDQADV